MKNTIARKLMAAAAAVMIMTAMSGCFAPQKPAEDSTADTPAVTASASDVSASDVSASDVSASDAASVQGTADGALEAYFAAFNSGDADMLADLTCSPAMEAFLKASGLDKSYIADSFRQTLDGMNQTAGGSFRMEYEVITAADATEAEKAELVTGIESLSAGSGAKVEAVRIYQLSMSAQSTTSDGDVVSSADAVSEQGEGQLRLYKYDGLWYVFGD